MKFYSETLDKYFDTQSDCIDAEKEYEETRKKAELEAAEKKNAISKRKKELSDNITASEKDVDAAYEKLKHAKAEASKILKEAEDKAGEIVSSATKEVHEALAARRNQIATFNKEFGPYMTTYTGERAKKEYDAIVDRINSMFDFSRLFWPFI